MLLLFLGVGAVGGFAQEESITTTSYKFLDVPPSPQSLANGGIILTYIDANPLLAFDNPALFGQETAGQLGLSYFNYMRGINALNAIYGSAIGDRGTWAVGVRALKYDEMQGYDTQGLATNKFTAMDAALEGLFSYDLTDNLRGGLALKAVYGVIEKYSAFALVSDAGLSYYDGKSGTSIGLTLTNVGGTLKSYGEQRSLPPWDIRVGYSQALSHAPFRVHVTLYGLSPYHIRTMGKGETSLKKVMRHFSLGAEFTPNEQFWVGVGYSPNTALSLSKQGARSLSGFSCGVGFNTDYLRLALSAAVYHPQVLGLMFSVSTNFGNDRFIF